MAGQPTFTRSKHYTYFHTSHKTKFEGSETEHVVSNLTASVDGNYKLKADVFHIAPRASFDGAVAFGGNVVITGDLAVTGSVIVTSSVLHMGDNIFGDADGDNHKFWGTTTASGGIFISGSLIGQANASIDGTLIVGGKTTVVGAIAGQSTASIDGTLAVGGNITGPKLTLTSSLLANANASIDGNLALGGDFKYNQFVAASLMGVDATVEGATGLGISGANDGWVSVYDIGNATMVYTPYWNRST